MQLLQRLATASTLLTFQALLSQAFSGGFAIAALAEEAAVV